MVWVSFGWKVAMIDTKHVWCLKRLKGVSCSVNIAVSIASTIVSSFFSSVRVFIYISADWHAIVMGIKVATSSPTVSTLFYCVCVFFHVRYDAYK